MSRRSLALIAVGIGLAVAEGCGGEPSGSGAGGSGGSAGAGGTGGGTGAGHTGAGDPGVDPCPDVPNPPGAVVDMVWPAPSNTGHEAIPGQTVRFHWEGSHNVLQVASFEGQVAPLPPLSDAGWPTQIKSGGKADGGAFDWNVGTHECGYRPGLYFFVDEDDPAGGVVAVSLTDEDASHYAPRPCSVLSQPGAYGGRYQQYADRPGCTVFEVNNFQTEPHFDWVQPIFTAKQGDLIVFRWTSKHNVVQVHDVTKDAPMPGGLNSGEKTNCVGGPHYSCANGPPGLGEYLIDTTDYRPGIIHISDECAQTCTGSPTGVNMEFDLRFPVPNNTPLPPVPGSCCAIDPSKGKDCRIVEIYNANDGAQFDYNVPVGRGDLVRFRWAGTLEVYQSTPNANGSPSDLPKPGGIAMAAPVECTPGPSMTCLEGTTAAAQLVVDVAELIDAGLVESDQFGNQWFNFHAKGENTPGFTSADTGTILYLDNAIPYDPDPPSCP